MSTVDMLVALVAAALVAAALVAEVVVGSGKQAPC
jgi:hypothetical protein